MRKHCFSCGGDILPAIDHRGICPSCIQLKRSHREMMGGDDAMTAARRAALSIVESRLNYKTLFAATD